VKRSIASELEFDKVQQLVAAQARTGLGRLLLTTDVLLPSTSESSRLAELTGAITRLIEEDGRLTFAGLDDALQWLEPEAPSPVEPGELLHLVTLAKRIASVRRRLLSAPGDDVTLATIGNQLPDTSKIVAWVAPRIGRDGTISDDASPELRRLRQHTARVRKELLGTLDEVRRGHPDVVTDAPPTVRRDRYCLPVRASTRTQMPGLLLDTSSRGATAFVEPFAVVELNNELTDSAAREREEIRRIVAEIVAAFAEIRDDLRSAVDLMATLDAAQARAIFGQMVEGRSVCPNTDDRLVLIGARHPLLDERLHPLRVATFGESEQRDPNRRVVPLDFDLPLGIHTLVISGPNAGGKTVVLKTVGLMALMAAHGIPLPADQGTTIPAFDQIWCHIGDEQNVAADLSSFSGAMTATADLLRQGGKGTLALYDELGAGTDPLEGAALGLATLEELTRRGCLTVATTHLASIALNATGTDGMDNAAMGYDEGRELPTYTLGLGRPGRSRAIEIARRTGIPEPLLERAGSLLGGDHLELDRWLCRLEEVEGELERQRVDLDIRSTEIDRLREEAARQIEQLQTDRDRVAGEATQERDRLRRMAKDKLDVALERLDRATQEQDRLGKRRRQRLREEAMDLGGEPQTNAPSAEETPELGTRVRITGLGSSGTLEQVRGERGRVSAGGKRLWVDLSDLEVIAAGPTETRRATVNVTADSGPDHELVLLGLDSEQGREELERFLDQAFTSGRPMVRVVHGHGTGVLRRMVAEVCRSHPAVRSFKHPPRHLGGTGATEVQLHPSD
jgi:DNA mismatch repair protein MutS2